MNNFAHGPLCVAPASRYLVHADGTPFFYLGDTAWELFHRLTREQAEEYLVTRARQRFTVIQAVVLAELNGVDEANPYGDLPLNDNDPRQPNERYFAHVDHLVARAAHHGLYIGMLPTWGSYACDEHHRYLHNHFLFRTPEIAFAYGAFLGARYGHCPNIIWVLGGDRAINEPAHKDIIRAMAAGLRQTETIPHLITLHPRGGQSSTAYFPDEDWLDFHMLQSGHCVRDNANYAMVAADYAHTPVKPCMDGEPRYEDHPIMTPQWQPAGGFYDDYDVRKAAYWATFAGAHGHTYGCHPVWQMYAEGRAPINQPPRPWRAALTLPGACQMQHLRALLESRPMLMRVPDQTLLASPEEDGGRHVQATRATDASYIFVYIPCAGQTVTLDLSRWAPRTYRMTWFNPRTGASTPCLDAIHATVTSLTTPPDGPDWVLVLDAA